MFHVAISQNEQVGDAVSSIVGDIKHALGQSTVDLAFLFCSTHFLGQVKDIAQALREQLGPRVLLGCMGEGIIGRHEEFEGSPVITVWAGSLPNVHLTPFQLTFSEENNTTTINGWPDTLMFVKERPTFLLLADPFSTAIDEVFAHLEGNCPGSPAIGGVASGGSDLGENCLILNDDVVHEGVVGVAVTGPVSIRTIVSQGCQPIGERYVITKSEGNIIYELGGVPTLERLQATLNELSSTGARRAALSLQVGVAFNEHQSRFERGDFLIRGLIGADQRTGGLAISDVINEGQTIQFHVRDAQAASEELNLMLAKDRVDFPDEVPKAALLFSCNGRGQRFFTTPHHDIAAVQKRMAGMPVAGFFAAGEIGPVGGKNFIHGYTASVALFAESK